MDIPILDGLAQAADRYDLFIIDLWGVVHDGVSVYPDAISCLRRLRQGGTKTVLLSNAARLGSCVALRLKKLGVSHDLYDWLLTSGDVTSQVISSTSKGYGANARSRYFHLGPKRCQPTIDACRGQEVAIEHAEIIICTGLVNDESDDVEDYRALLAAAVSRSLPMICANPDISIKRGGRIIYGAGAIAALYKKLGGTVRSYGKPHSAIFDRVFDQSPDIQRCRSVMIGDSLATDVRGARHAGIDAIWIGGGIHAEDLSLTSDKKLEPDKVAAVASHLGELPIAILPQLKW